MKYTVYSEPKLAKSFNSHRCTVVFMSELELEIIKENFPILQLRIYDQNPINLIQLWGDRKRA